MKSRKKILASLQEKEDACLARQKKLDERETLETEEKRKRAEEDDAYDYLGTYGTSKNGGFKATGKSRGLRAGPSSNTTALTNKANSRKISTSAISDKPKRKTVTSSIKR